MEIKDELEDLRKLCKELEDILGKSSKRKNPWDNLNEKEKKEYVSLLLKI